MTTIAGIFSGIFRRTANARLPSPQGLTLPSSKRSPSARRQASKALNSRDDYRYFWDNANNELRLYDKINPRQYVFHEDTETITVVYSEYFEDYKTFYDRAKADLDRAKATREYGLDEYSHPNWFDASSLPWLSFDSMTVELPDGYLYFNPIVNWGKFREENGRLLMPVAIRLNHALADGFLAALFYRTLEKEIAQLCGKGVVE